MPIMGMNYYYFNCRIVDFRGTFEIERASIKRHYFLEGFLMTKAITRIIRDDARRRRNFSWNLVILALLAGILLAGPASGVYAGAGGGNVKPDETAPIETDGTMGIVGISAELGSGDVRPDETAPIGTDGSSDIVGISADLGMGGMNQGKAAFSYKTGTVTLVDIWNGQTFIRIEEAEGGSGGDVGETDFLIADGKTVLSDLNGLVDKSAFKAGMTVEAYYVAPVVMTLQYPARYEAAVLVVRNENNPGAAFVGVVNKDGLASDGSVKLNIGDKAEIIRQSDGAKISVADAGGAGFGKRPIIAYYAVTTRSMPPQALVTKVAVLDKAGIPLFVNGLRVYGAEAVIRPGGSVLVPLRAVVEAVGQTVEWNDAEQSVRVGVAIYVKIGSDEYIVGRMAPLKLDAAAVLINSRTYVPVSFFESVLNMKFDDASGLISFTDLD